MDPTAAAPSPRGSGSPGALRAANRARVVQALSRLGDCTQAELARSTGLSPATISNLVRVLVADGVVRTTATTRTGRRAVLVSLAPHPADRIALGIDIGRQHLRLLACTPSRQIVAERVDVVPLGHRAEETIDRAAALLASILEETGLSRSAVIGCCAGVPGPIDARSGDVGHGAILPEWVGLHLRDFISRRLGIPVHVENDANLGAIAEVAWGGHGDVADLVFVKVGTGIGAGLILGQQLHRGHIGLAGELGHISVTDAGPICRCGSRGCLESAASTSAMVKQLHAGTGPSRAGFGELLELAREGDPAVRRIVEDAGLAIGRTLGAVVNLLGPGIIVLGGPVVPLGDLLTEPVRRGLSRWSYPVLSAATTVVMSSLGGRAEALGACAQVLGGAAGPLRTAAS